MALDIANKRSEYSLIRLNELKEKLENLSELKDVPNLTIFAAGSYARLEASEYSDIDMFFLSSSDGIKDEFPRTNSLRMFGKMIDVIRELRFPRFSNDCQYLEIIDDAAMCENLGSPTDDHQNFFTVRLLLLLESHCLYGNEHFEKITTKIIDSYFNDYPDHSDGFKPIFLLNDIGRYWKTILLNYENKRKVKPNNSDDQSEIDKAKIKQKVRNFKVKFSRMTICFASIAAIGSLKAPVTQDHVIEIIKLTPRDRLKRISENIPSLSKQVETVLEKYDWFLEMTGLTTDLLEEQFSDKQKRTEMFSRANEYGDVMYDLIRSIDEQDKELRLLRYLVI
jgi:predicted nucleotidyltransferase